MIEVVIIFFIYAIMGWFLEVAFNALTRGEFVNAGLLNGPWCPIYGFGMLAVISLLEPIRGSLVILFIGAVLITSLLELLTGIVLEKVFHKKWWDYSDRPFNLGGYICLLFSVGWGLAGVFVVELVHPGILRIMRASSETVDIVVIVVLAFIFLVDITVSFNTIFKLNRKLEYMQELTNLIRRSSDEIGETVASGVIGLSDMKDEMEDRWEEGKQSLSKGLDKREFNKFEQILSKLKSREWTPEENKVRELIKVRKDLLQSRLPGERRLIQAFPKLDAKEHHESFKTLKDFYERLNHKREQRKEKSKTQGEA